MVLTMKGARASRYFKDRVEPDGPAPTTALFEAERTYAIKGIDPTKVIARARERDFCEGG